MDTNSGRTFDHALCLFFWYRLSVLKLFIIIIFGLNICIWFLVIQSCGGNSTVLRTRFDTKVTIALMMGFNFQPP